MSEAQLIETDSMSHKRNQSRINKDEAELAELMKQLNGGSDEDQEDTEVESSSEELIKPEVQAESNTEQKEKPKAEAQEDDAELSAEEKTFKQRYGDLRRYIQDKEKEYQDKLNTLSSQLDAAVKNELVLPKTDDEVDAWAKQYPEVASVIEAIADRKAQQRSSDLDTRLKEIEKLRSQARREKAEAELYNLHPDFADIRSDDKFHEWAKDQPKVVQDALYENVDDIKSVARVLDLYKADKGIKTPKRNMQEDKSAASSVKAKRAAVDPNDASSYLSETQVQNMSIKEYEKRMDEIMEAQRTGKFIYDITRK